MNVSVFCSSNNLPEKYTKPARELARIMAEQGCNLVYGGSNSGLMGVMADTMQANGAKIIGVTLPIYSANRRENIDEMIVAKTLGERKAAMLERSDVALCLVGGIGTLDELTELFELKRQQYHNKTIIVLNTDGFYDGLKMQLQRISDENLLKAGENAHIPVLALDDLIRFVDRPEQALDLLTVRRSLTAIEK